MKSVRKIGVTLLFVALIFVSSEVVKADEFKLIPSVGVREEYNAWVMGGSKGVIERAGEIANQLMDDHQPIPLPDHAERELQSILAAAEVEKIPA